VRSRYEALPHDFYARPSLEVASDLIGHLLLRQVGEAWLGGWIVETEAYGGASDPASHAYRGPTDRNRVMFGPAGHLYVYRSYGIHYCANVVTGIEGQASAVLLRAVQPEYGIDAMRRLRHLETPKLLCSGPGRLCRALDITRGDNGQSLMDGNNIFISQHKRDEDVAATRRIGVSEAVDFPWRFVADGSSYLSRPHQTLPRSKSERRQTPPRAWNASRQDCHGSKPDSK
jgi:DNA-3-methyladenine glycosylase